LARKGETFKIRGTCFNYSVFGNIGFMSYTKLLDLLD
jgi:hypothetical protein